MSQNRTLRAQPVALTTTLTTNILNPAAAGAGVGYTPTASYILLTRIHVVNKTANSASFSLWTGATGANAAGTEWFNGQTVAGNSAFSWPCRKRLEAADFLVGGSNTAMALTIEFEGEVGLV